MEDHDEAQHRLEQKALRNVRQLVEKAQDEERAGLLTRNYAWSVVGAVVIAVAVFAGIVYGVTEYRAGERKALQAQVEASRNANQPRIPRLPPAHLARRVSLDESMDARYMPYAAECLAILEKRINTLHRKDVAGVDGQARLLVVIRSDGLIPEVEVKESSGHSATEPSARRLVRMAEPCGVFPPVIQETADYLHLQTTLRLDGSAASGPVATFVAAKPGGA